MLNIGKPKEEVLILVKESGLGLTTYLSPQLYRMNEAYKEQLKSFITKIQAKLGEK